MQTPSSSRLSRFVTRYGNVSRYLLSLSPRATSAPLSPSRKKFALLIGVNYDRKVKDHALGLKASHKDVFKVKGLLIKYYGYKEEDIIVLIDSEDGDEELMPTHDNIMNAIRSFIRPGESNVNYFFMYSGHSYQRTEERQPPTEEDGMEEYIIPSDALRNASSWDEAVIHDKVITDWTLNRELVKPLNKLKGCQLVALFDSCHSGTLLNLKHHRCNRVGCIKSLLRRVGRRLLIEPIHRRFNKIVEGNSAIALSPESSVTLPPKASMEKARRQCSGFCPRIPTFERPLVICISACKDEEETAELNEGGAMTTAFVDFLSANPYPTYKQLMCAVYTGVKSARAICKDKAEKYYKAKLANGETSEKANKSSNIIYNMVSESRALREFMRSNEVKIWHPQLSSLKPLNMNDILMLNH